MLAILLSTFDRYQSIAHWTEHQLNYFWPNHPPVFFSGLNHQGDRYLGFTSEVSDWMGVTLEAVKKLRQAGFTHAYLILDDHPPMGACHEQFLNETLPALARKLEAICIHLLGYGQHRPVQGEILGKQDGFLERCARSYPWKFSLHPALWNLESLQTLLEQRCREYSQTARTAWNFERHQDQPDDPCVGPMLSRCFRISGKHFFKKPTIMTLQRWIWIIIRLGSDVLFCGVGKISGEKKRLEVEQRLLWLYGYYAGPYPLFWSGLMHKGKPHYGWEQWLRYSGSRYLQAQWHQIKNKI